MNQPAPPPASSRGPAGNPYGSYVNNSPAGPAGGHAAGYPEDRARTDTGYGSYPAAADTGYPDPPFRPPAGSDPAAGRPGQDSGWHAAPPPAAPDISADPASHYFYTGGSGYPDAAGYGAGRPAADPGYPAGYTEPAEPVTGTYNGGGYADGYGTDPYDPDGYGGYQPRQA